MYRVAAILPLLLVAVASGCVGTEERCPVCGMPTDVYDGPRGKVLFQDGDFVFCSTADMFQVLVQPGFNYDEVEAVKVQDTAASGWETPEGHWIDAEEAYYVAGSDREAAMGGTFVSFASREDAEAFAERHGGTVLEFGEIDREALGEYTRFD